MIVRAFLSIKSAAAQKRIRRLLRELEVVVVSGRKGRDLWDHLASQSFDLVLLGRDRLPAPEDESISAIQALPGTPAVILFADEADAVLRAQLMATGCDAVLSPDIPDDTLKRALAKWIAKRRDTEQLRIQAGELIQYRLGDFVSFSPSMRSLLDIAGRVAEVDTTVLVLGETGVGKEWLARAIHSESKRAKEPFVAVNCGAIPEGLVESHLFGHRAGAFTGATADHRGYFELAHGGTIFLDEVVEMPVHLQVRLLRVLQEQAFHRVGSDRTIKVDVRVIAATNRNPKTEIDAGRLRKDLYYRLGVVTLEVPPLRNRREDIRSLAMNHFEIFCARLSRHLTAIDPDAMDALIAYDWPGNVRELINVMERGVLVANGRTVTVADLPEPIGRRAASQGAPAPRPATAVHDGSRAPEALVAEPLGEARRKLLESFEKHYFTALLTRHRGRVGEVATHAGITPRALFDKMKRYSLRKEDFKESS